MMSNSQDRMVHAEALLQQARTLLSASGMSRRQSELVDEINVFLNPPSLDSVSLERLAAFKARLTPKTTAPVTEESEDCPKCGFPLVDHTETANCNEKDVWMP